MKDKPRQIIIHLLGCISFLALAFIPNFQGKSNTIFNPAAMRELLSYTLLILTFYVHYFLIVPRLYFTKKYILYGLSVMVMYLAFQGSINAFHPKMGPPLGLRPPMQSPRPLEKPSDRPGPDLFMDINQKVFPFLVVVFFSLMLRISNRWQQTEKEKINSELSYLKAQINPHFLFNTLNSIYSLAIQKSDETPEAIVKLSGMMRYVLSESANEFVLLSKEINYIQNYVDLQKIRFGSSLPLTFSIKGLTQQHKIAPLLLIPFIENAFKHGVNAEEDSAIRIAIIILEDTLQLSVYNKKVMVSISEENRSGIGITNTKNRLNLLYPQQHSLSLEDRLEDYLVTLKIELS